MTFSPDGKTVAAACASIRLYDPDDRGQSGCAFDRKASDLHFTDDGKTLTGRRGRCHLPLGHDDWQDADARRRG